MADGAPPSGLRLLVEDEFLPGGLAASLARAFSPRPLAPVGPADYPRFERRDLLLTRHRGQFIKPCPGTLNYNCCGLQIFHFGLGCTLGCRYCILEAYLGSRALVLFGNIDEGLDQLAALLDRPPAARPLRFGTGEFTDSLLLDRHSGLAARLIKIFAGRREAVLELKTKTDQVDHLLNLPHLGRTVISFSVNAPLVCRSEEGGAAPLEARLAAARRAAAAGFPIGLHFDPLILHPGWEDGYRETLALIDGRLKGAELAWVSLGGFRYLPALKEVMLARFPGTGIYDAEFVVGGDGKMRYPRPLRTRLYRLLVSGLRKILPPETVIYLCMESPRLWRDVFGRDPGSEGLTAALDRRARQLAARCPA
ncbi:MAG: DNA photolyase [Candidatus Adiutrix sp.]|nr:DNA photolyase [Candidatus Adiutrix sp.]